ncbi:MAG: hypothetical protein ACUVWP_05285 [bacterium]
MWLITTLICAVITTILWFLLKKRYKLGLLCLMLWGATIMILVDHLLGYSGGAFIEAQTDGLIRNGTLLGIIMLIPVFFTWIIVLSISRVKR